MKRSVSLLLSFLMFLLPCLSLLSGCGPVEKDAYEITFSVGGNKTTETVKAGEVPEYTGKTEWETADHYYKITGWDKEFAPAAKDVTYTAIVGEYGLTLYDVLFILPSGIVKVPTHEGEIPTPPAGYETDESRAKEIGTFVRWDKELTAPTAENTKNGKTKMTYTPTYTYEARYLAEILPAKDGAKAVLTISYDDGNYDSAVWVNQKNKTYGLKGSCMIIAGRDSFTGKVSQWKTLLADGTLDIQSHGWYHDHDHTDYGSHADHVKDVVTSKEALERYFPNNDVLVYATPYTKITDYSYAVSGNENSQIIQDGGTRALIHANYYANRNGPSGLQSLDPTMGDGKGSWYNLYVQWLKTESSQTNKIRTGWIDNAVKQGGWLIILAHSVVDDPDNEWNISKTNAEAFYKHAQTYVKTGELWSATFGEAVKYIRERQNTTVTERYEDGTVFVDMKINRTTEDGLTLTQKVFNYPLTVEVRVPSGWKLALSTNENGETMTSAVYTRNGVSYTRVNMVPGADGATVTTQIAPFSVN